MKDLKDKVVLVTGASRGIGLLTAKTLAKAGFQVFAAIRGTEERNAAVVESLNEYAKQNNVQISAIEMDVTNEVSVNKAIEKIEQTNAIDVVINNAGIMPVGLTEAYTIDDYQKCKKNVQELLELQNDSDVSIRNEAAKELQQGNSQLKIFETNLFKLLIPKDINDKKNIYIYCANTLTLC